MRVTLMGILANARCTVQIDVGFGDAITPRPRAAIYPVLLNDLPAPKLRTYPMQTVIAEKLHAIAVLGMVNSRMKDYLDLVVMVEHEAIDPAVLARAIAATFQRRNTTVPQTLPVGLSDEFAIDASRVALWRALLKNNGIAHRSLQDVVTVLRTELWPVMSLASNANAPAR